MNIKTGILNVPKHVNKHDLIHFVTFSCGKNADKIDFSVIIEFYDINDEHQ